LIFVKACQKTPLRGTLLVSSYFGARGIVRI
jgi:hypothetical protein